MAVDILRRSMYSTLLVLLVCLSDAQLFLYNGSVGTTQNLSTACTNALLANISCPAQLVVAAGDNSLVPSDTVVVPQICSMSCSNSLATYHKNVSSACLNDPNPWTGVPATYPGDVLWAYANRTCLKNATTGQYCVDEVLAWNANIPASNNYNLSSGIPQQYLCSHCFLAMLSQAQGTPFSNYYADLVSDWQGIQSICKVSYSTVVQTAVANFTTFDQPYVNTLALAPVPCLSANLYTVQAGDTCNSISAARKVSTGTLIVINNLYADCSALTIGSSICLPQTCTTYTVGANDTCWSIAAVQTIGVYQLQGWNPAINPTCSNLNQSSTLCISPPGGTYNGTTIVGATPTQANQYATSAVAPPGSTPFGTTSHCGKYYQVASGDNCQQISLNQTVTVPLFELINPSINSGCTNLVPGLWYCIMPTSDWNATINNCTAATTVAPTAPTSSGATANCFQWYTVKSGDYCALIEQEFNITMVQLQQWNPNLNSTCGNLVLGDAYCVNGIGGSCASSTMTASKASSTSSTSSKASSTSSTSSKASSTSSTSSKASSTSSTSSKASSSSSSSSKTSSISSSPSTKSSSSTSSIKSSTKTSSTTSKTSSTTTSSAIATPTPHQPNMVSGCTKFYLAVSGDTCQGIATTYSITLANFYAWNPDVGSTCSSLWAGDYYCVSHP